MVAEHLPSTCEDKSQSLVSKYMSKGTDGQEEVKKKGTDRRKREERERKKNSFRPDVETHTCNPSTQDADTGSCIVHEFKDSLDYQARP